MKDAKLGLDAWRDAEHRRNGHALGSFEWQEAEEDVLRARKVFHAEVAQVSARYAEEAFHDRNRWSAQLDPRTSGPRGSVAEDSLA